MGKPLAIDLFCGLGGWTSALLEEGYDVIGFDIERHEYGEHHYPAQLVLQDVRTLHGSQFKGAALIVASPPCQEYSYMAMPWKRAKAKAAAIRADTSGKMLADLNRLFDACFRIQKEASIAAGRHVPLIVENVRGAQPWVGRSRWAFGSFHLWGDVPALMPMTAKAVKVGGLDWNRYGEPGYKGEAFNTHADRRLREEMGVKDKPYETGNKNNGGSWFAVAHNTTSGKGRNPDGRKVGEGRKGAGAGAGAEWFDSNLCQLPSSSPRRKMASAMIAKIPQPLARHIARTYLP